MEEFKRFEKNTFISLLAFTVPALIMMLIFIRGEYAPFGKVSILVADMRYQFVDYIGYMKSVFFGNNDMLYSFSKTFGGDMMGFASYYLFNPFFLILLLFPNDMLPIGIVLMMILICGFMGLNFYLLLCTVWGNRFSSLIFSTAYAMMGFNMAYINCIHYFFSIMMLPIVILGLYRIMTGKKPSIIYIASAAASVISCYYIGYMILIFTAFFYLCLMFSGVIEFAGFKARLKNAWTVLYSTLLAVGISAFSLLSVLLSLQGQKKAVLKGLSFTRTFSIAEFFSGLYSGAFRGNISDGLPIIYCGVVSVVFTCFFFLNPTIKIRRKISAALVFVFLIAGFLFDPINVAWHGFAHPIGFPFRNSFLFSFITLLTGYYGFVHIKEGYKRISVAIVAAFFVLYSAYLYIFGSSFVKTKSILVTVITAAIALMLIEAMNEKNRYIIPALAGLFVLQIADSFYNGSSSIDAYFDDKYSEENSLEAYQEYLNETQTLISYINENDPSFFRMDKLFRRTHNDPMMFAYNGLSHFSSCETEQVKTFMGRMGFRNNENWAFYGDASTGFADCFMGLKYLISQYDETSKPFNCIYSENEKRIYENPYALALGFGMDESVRNINMTTKDPFLLQNDIASRFSKTNYQIYKPVKVEEVRLNNVTEEDHVYKQIDKEKEASIEYMLSISSNSFIYMYFDAPRFQNTTLYINGDEKGNYFEEYAWSVREGGYYKPGETISIKFVLEDDSIEIDNAYFYYESAQVLKAWYKDATSTVCDITKISSSHLKADIDADNESEYIVFTIPYEEDWKVTLDGKKVNPVKVMDALMAVRISKGVHEIELRYFPRGLAVGLPVTIMSAIATFCVFFAEFKKKTQVEK